MELSTNRNLDMFDKADISVPRKDEDFFQEDKKYSLSIEDISQYSTVEKCKIYSIHSCNISTTAY